MGLSLAELQAIRAKYQLVSLSQIPQTGLAIRDGGRTIQLWNTRSNPPDWGGQVIPEASMPAALSGMREGEIRPIVPTRGDAVETGAAEIVWGAVTNPAYDPSLLGAGIRGVTRAVGENLGNVVEGVGGGLMKITLFGIPVPLLLVGVGIVAVIVMVKTK